MGKFILKVVETLEIPLSSLFEGSCWFIQPGEVGAKGKLSCCLQLVEGNGESGARLCSEGHSKQMRGIGLTLQQEKFQLVNRKKFFKIRAVKHWSGLLKDLAEIQTQNGLDLM